MRNLQDAIDRSMGHTEIVAADFVGDESDLVAELSSLYDGEVDSVRENDGTIDVWGWAGGMTDDHDWRLRVTLTD